MSLTITIEELLGYTNGERMKWQRWFEGQPKAVFSAPVQREGQFSSVWQLLDHIFLVEKRHTQRLTQESPLLERTGLPEGNHAAMFAFAQKTRQELSRFLRSIDENQSNTLRDFEVRDTVFRMTPRKLAFHIFFHEIRHWAQVATAVRNAGFPPPGEHDLFYSDALK